MERITRTGESGKNPISDRYQTEVKYQIKLRPIIIFIALPAFVFFAFYHFLHGNPIPGTIFTLLTVNAVVTLVWASRTKEIQKLARLNRVGLTIAFGLLAFVFVCGVFTDDVYIVIPWVFTYPAVILLMMGGRPGILGAAAFVMAFIVVLVIFDLPPWSEATRLTFKINMAFALIALFLYTLVAERSRVRIRNHLLDARNKYKASEERQRLTNEELKSEIEMRVQSEKALSRSEMQYRALFEESAVGLWEENQSEIKAYLDNLPHEAMADLENYLQQHRGEIKKYINTARITAVNRAALKLYEASSMQALLENMRMVLPPDIVGWTIQRVLALYRDGSYQSQVEPRTIHGRKLNVLLSSTVPAGYENSWEKVYTSIYDITDRVAVEEEKKRVEQQLQHTRQIQAVASLAGGIAHQFNNALAAICGSVDLLELQTPLTPDTEPLFNTLHGSSERVRRLTEQLLAYARGGKYLPTDYAARELIQNVLQTNGNFFLSGVTFQTHFEDPVVLCQCDITQIRSVLDAVFTNAVEAMADGGEVIISTHKVCLAEGQTPAAPGLAPGHYARITVEDSGEGMDAETCRRIFEPFFSTKFIGRGLGMAAAHGIVCNHGGLIQVASEPGAGTRVMIYLPCLA